MGQQGSTSPFFSFRVSTKSDLSGFCCGLISLDTCHLPVGSCLLGLSLTTAPSWKEKKKNKKPPLPCLHSAGLWAHRHRDTPHVTPDVLESLRAEMDVGDPAGWVSVGSKVGATMARGCREESRMPWLSVLHHRGHLGVGQEALVKPAPFWCGCYTTGDPSLLELPGPCPGQNGLVAPTLF